MKKLFPRTIKFIRENPTEAIRDALVWSGLYFWAMVIILTIKKTLIYFIK